jgi:hypothetical protein
MTFLDERDVFLENEARIVLSNYGLSNEDAIDVMREWSEEVFENDLIVYRNGKKAILEGRNSAIAALQTICTRKVMERANVKRAPLSLPKTEDK